MPPWLTCVALSAMSFHGRNHGAEGSVSFSMQIVPACGEPDCKGVSMTDLGHGVTEVIVMGPGVYDRYVTAYAPEWRYSEQFTMTPEATAVAWR